MAALLVVEDDPVSARAVARALRAAGHTPAVARSCAEARAVEERFVCGVLDVDLGDGDGVDLARELIDRGSIGSVVFYSGSVDADVARRAAELGPRVLKSEPTSRLLAELSRLIAG